MRRNTNSHVGYESGYCTYVVRMQKIVSRTNRNGFTKKEVVNEWRVRGIVKDTADKLAYVFRQHPEAVAANSIVSEYYEPISVYKVV